MEDYKKTDDERDLPKRPWDTCREVPIIEDEQTPWKMIKLLRTICLLLTAIIVFGLALCSKTSFLLLITLSNEGTRILSDERKPVALLCIGCALMTPSVLLFLQSIWKACYKTSKSPAKATIALVLFFEFLVSLGAAILTIVAMPHLDIVTNVTILNGVAVLSALLQVITQCTAKERNRYLVPSITALLLILLGYILFLYLYITKDPTNTKMSIWVGLAVGGSFFVSLNWWENYLRLISKNSSSVILKSLCMDVKRSQNMLNMLTSLLRIVVIGCVLGAYVPLAQMDWDIVNSIPSRETRIIGILIGVQLISSVLCHWFSLAACKMHALRRCFILPIYFASLAVMALLIIPVIVYYQDYRISLNGTTTNFTSYCSIVVDGRSASLNGSVFPDLVYDVTHSLCYLDMSEMIDIGLLTGSAVSWWLGLVLATIHLWHLSLYRIQRTQELFIRRLYEGGFMEQSLLLNTRFDVQTTEKRKKFRSLDPAKVYLCATMWHETYDEMMKIIISIFRLDKYRPLKEGVISDVVFEGHVYFDDAFKNVTGSHGRHVNEYAEMLVNIIREVYGIFLDMDKGLFRKRQQIPNQGIVRTSYGGRLVFTLPHGNSLTVHFKDKHLIRHKKRWSQVMYLYYLLGWKLSTKYFKKWNKVGVDEDELKREFQKEKHNTYILALDGDTDFHPAAVMLLVDRLKLYPQVGAACGRIHPTGSGPMVWYQKFEYAVGHWLHKTAEHVYGCVLCSPGCFSLFRSSALMDNNVMKKYTVKASKPADHIQYDQGEDRWLCTLLLKQGWRVEYNAAADAYTNAPEEFKEFFNQRRRWGPSTMANIVDLLGSTTLLCKRNPSMSKPYMIYQLFSLASSILSPSTVVLMIAGSLTILLDIHPNWALVIAVIPPAIFLGVSFKIKADTQITIAAILGILYAFLMMISSLVVIGNMVEQQTIMTPSSLFIISLACFYLFTALLHPQEIGLIIYGLLYIICIPSAYLLLSIYSMVNMNNVSWGTRETAAPAGAAQQAVVTPQTKTQKAKSAFTRFFMQSKCCRKLCKRDDTEELIANQENRVMRVEKEEIQPQNTIVGDVMDSPRTPEPVFTCPNQCWVTQLQSLSDDMLLQEDELDQDEDEFFREMITKYLEPLPEDKKKQKEMSAALMELRNKITFVYFICNAFWLIATFTLQLASTSVFIQVPKVDINMQPTGDYLFIEPVGFMFIIAFALLVLVQFIAMLYHRTYTLIHFIAFLDTEATLERRAYDNKEVTDDKDNNGYNDDADEDDDDDDEDDDEDEDDRDSLMFSSMYSRSQESGTMV